ncbi:MAG: hypothetical protein A2X86_16860 [Bdellovibrionales bacterium GWA2_49_15]|nr:MAG: hypothetical protein A2X86_16860 [Bdellovibrionales bacterium GWA2_49_15]HAZ12454.1 hypothetical protein [Bdellovibrionales bacterium]
MGLPQDFLQRCRTLAVTSCAMAISAQISAQTLETNLTPNPWSGNLSVSLSTNAEKWGNEDQALSNDYMLGLKRPIGAHSLDFSLTSSKDLIGERKYQWNNVSVGHATPSKSLNRYFDVKLRTSLAAPLNENQRKNETLISQVTLSPSLSVHLEELGFSGVSLAYRPFLRQSFHEYTISAEGRSNTERSMRQRLSLGFSITDNFSLDFDGSYQRNFTYQGTATDSYSHDESITYSFTPSFSCSLGHSNEGSALAPDGQTSNLEFSNIRTSMYYGSADFTF